MSQVLTKNRQGTYLYTILEKEIAGIQLVGSEVKSIKDNNLNINEAYCLINNGELFIRNMYIGEYSHGGRPNNHEPLRERKLLLHKKEINKLNDKVKQKGLTIIPLAVLLTKTGFIKLEIGLAKGKAIYEKRNSIKEKDLKRDLDRSLRND